MDPASGRRRRMGLCQMQARTIFRHSAWIRLTHWINLLCLILLLMSGLQILDAHPALYWGDKSVFLHPLVAIPGGIPHAVTIPHYQDLASGRRWHFFFAWIFVANGMVYLLFALIGPHVRRDLLPDRAQLRGIGRSVIEHLHLRFPRGEDARRYNALQKLSYLIVIFVLLPLMLATGLTMSPAMDTGFPILLDVFDGRQSARTIHLCIAALLVLFTLVHVAMVLLSGVLNNMRSMITGRYALPPGREQ